ncbi:uncharacterized protein [Euwallacea fornicatus]|uniref:uncharacterized protein n=1 Tax=Euwallacea fornicatus TaxID=995702 RepID=UPI00338E34AF
MKLHVGYKNRLMFTFVVVSLCISASVGRHIPIDFDLEASAAEPRPIVIETGPSAEALPLVYNVEPSAEPTVADLGSDPIISGPLTEASEKIEKVLTPASTFTYSNNNKQNEDADREPAESKIEDLRPEPIEYHEFLAAASATNEKKEVPDKKTNPQPIIENGELVAESKHHKQEHKDEGGDGEFEKGGGKEFHAHHDGQHGEKGEKDYKGHHHHEKGHKGHHDKENHHKEYDEGGGDKKEHHHDDGYHGEHFRSHGGKKGAKYKEEGEHSKGHSTKGSHSIHKKDEFEKKTEFFEEDHEGGDSEKQGGYSHSEEFKKGGHSKSGHKHGGHHKEEHGKKSEHQKGGHHKEEHGHDEKEGRGHHHAHDTQWGEKDGKSDGKKWAFKKSSGTGGGGGGGHGHGAHSHQTYTIQQPPKAKHVHGPAAHHSHQSYAVQQPPTKKAPPRHPFQGYDISPISTFVLPLEEGSGVNEPRLKSSVNSYGHPNKKNDASVQSSKVRTKKRKPTPTDDFLADNPFSSEIGSSKSDDIISTSSSIDDYIQKELDLMKAQAQPAKESSSKPPPGTITKRRRLKKRKMVKDANSQASSLYPKGSKKKCHKKERVSVVPEESSHNFVIVAADDAV